MSRQTLREATKNVIVFFGNIHFCRMSLCTQSILKEILICTFIVNFSKNAFTIVWLLFCYRYNSNYSRIIAKIVCVKQGLYKHQYESNECFGKKIKKQTREVFCKKRPSTLIKRHSNTGVFLWVLRNFQEELFWGTSVKGCFCAEKSQFTSSVGCTDSFDFEQTFLQQPHENCFTSSNQINWSP